MNIRIAASDEEIAACYPVMRALRPQVAHHEFVARVRRQQGAGYRLAFIEEAGGVRAVAGFRVGENLAWGRFLYVDDLVTLPAFRSRGYGATLLNWLKECAAKEGCQQIHLESGLQRRGAHRFYEREGMTMTSLHFSANAASRPAGESPSKG